MSPAKEPMMCFSPSSTTLTMKARPAVRAAHSMSLWMGLFCRLPVRAWGELMNSPEWLAMIVL